MATTTTKANQGADRLPSRRPSSLSANKRRRISSAITEIPNMNNLPEGILSHVTQFLSSPARLLFAAAMTPRFSARLTGRTNEIMLPNPAWHGDLVPVMIIPQEDPDARETEEPYEPPKFAIRSECNAQGTWSRLDFADFGHEVASKLTDDEIRLILECIHAQQELVTLRLTGCVNITGSCLDVLRGSTTLRHLDLSLVMHSSPILQPVPPISEEVIIPILATMMYSETSSLQFLCFPYKWRAAQSWMFHGFLICYNNYLLIRSLWCRLCRPVPLIQDADGDGSVEPQGAADQFPQPPASSSSQPILPPFLYFCHILSSHVPTTWVVKHPSEFPHMTVSLLMKKYGLQRFTCHKCFDCICYDCAHDDGCYSIQRHCVNCQKDYCAECGIGSFNCDECEDFLCRGCEESGVSLVTRNPEKDGEEDKFAPRICEGCSKLVGCGKKG